MDALPKENTGRTVQLRNNNPFGTINDEAALICYIGYRTQINILNNSVKVLVLGIGAIQLELSLQRHTVRQAAFYAFLNGITGRINAVIQELQNKVVTGVGYREIFQKNLIQPFKFPLFRCGAHLKKFAERL